VGVTALDADPRTAADDQIINAERIVLGAMMSGGPDVVADIAGRLTADDFTRPAHGRVFQVICDLWAGDQPTEPMPIVAEMQRRAAEDRAHPAYGVQMIYLVECVEAVPSLANAGWYAGQVAAAGYRRRTAEVLTSASGRLAAGADPAEVAAWTTTSLDSLGRPGKPARTPTGRRARVTWGTEIEPEPPRWAWNDDGSDLPPDKLASMQIPVPFGRLPVGAMAIAAGREGTGKSSFGIWLAAHITRGTLPGDYFGTPRRVFYVAVEDSWKHTLMPRMIAAGVNRSMIGRFDVVVDEDTELTLSLPADLQLLEEEMSRHRVALLVIDPLMSAIGSNIDTHKERDTRTALDPLAKLADRTGAVILGIAHFSKASGTDVSALITGSGAFKNVARSIFGFARDQEDGTRIFTQVKNSLGRDHHDLPSLAYEIDNVTVETRKGPAHVGRFRFAGMSEQSVHEALGGSRSAYSTRDAEAWLREYLDDAGGAAPSKEIKEAAKEEGITDKILRKARESLNVTIEQSGFPKTSTWRLGTASVVPSGAQSVPPSPPTRLGATAALGTTAGLAAPGRIVTESSDAARSILAPTTATRAAAAAAVPSTPRPPAPYSLARSASPASPPPTGTA